MENAKNTTTLVPLGVMARLLHVPSRWLRAEVAAGRIPALRADNRLVFRPDIVLPIVAERAKSEADRAEQKSPTDREVTS
jgi:hypothetical protein